MCGLTGFLNCRRDQSSDEMLSIVARMAETLHHRGPDDIGTWCDPLAGIAFGFQRLSIIDLSPAGHQPMISSCGRYALVFNGEIYNAAELRQALVAKGRSFRGRSDTEVLVEGFAEWGIVETIKQCLGMFAIAAWDKRERTLSLIRDRLGKKPLYYGRFGTTLLFGSETKSLRAHPAFEAAVDRRALTTFLMFSYLVNSSIYKDVYQVPPGHVVTVKLDDDDWWRGIRNLRIDHYWRFDDVALAGLEHPFSGSYEQATEELDALLTDAVGRRMVADVPLGAFLSGGIDSSIVVALMQKQSSRPVKTFTIGFEEEAYNEAPFAKRVAEHLKTDHTELYVTPKEARDVIPLLPTIFDEPFADSSQIPTYLVSKLARQHVTVSLSGDGGDELFCGYRRYFEALAPRFGGGGATAHVARALLQLPAFLRKPLAGGCRAFGKMPLGQLAHLFERGANVLEDDDADARYLRNFRHWPDGSLTEQSQFVDRGQRYDWAQSMLKFGYISTIPPVEQRATPQQRWQWFDTQYYLPSDILTKVDRASMAVSLEARVPLLDHRVVEFAWTLPHSFKVSDGQGKRILRAVLSRYVPSELFERPKVGFGVPIDVWLRGPLRDWAEDLLDEGRLKREGYLNSKPIRQKWAEHLGGRADWHYLLWDVLMFQAWLSSVR